MGKVGCETDASTQNPRRSAARGTELQTHTETHREKHSSAAGRLDGDGRLAARTGNEKRWFYEKWNKQKENGSIRTLRVTMKT